LQTLINWKISGLLRRQKYICIRKFSGIKKCRKIFGQHYREKRSGKCPIHRSEGGNFADPKKHGGKKGPQNFPYVVVKEEILWTKKKFGKYLHHYFYYYHPPALTT
jgi:hypothetical protein